MPKYGGQNLITDKKTVLQINGVIGYLSDMDNADRPVALDAAQALGRVLWMNFDNPDKAEEELDGDEHLDFERSPDIDDDVDMLNTILSVREKIIKKQQVAKSKDLKEKLYALQRAIESSGFWVKRFVSESPDSSNTTHSDRVRFADIMDKSKGNPGASWRAGGGNPKAGIGSPR